MKNIWIVNQYTSTPDTGMGGRHHYLAQGLAALGNDVTLIGARWHHLLHNDNAAIAAPDVEERDGYRFARIPVSRYSHAHDKRRILNWILFARRLRHLPSRLGQVPDAILYSSPSLLGFRGAERLARQNGARLVFEVRDIWPLTLKEVGGKPTFHPLITWMQRVEDRAYRVSDAVVSNLSHAEGHMLSRGLSNGKFTYIPNGISLSEVSSPEPLSDKVKAALPKDKFIIGYTGTLGLANRIDVLIDAAAALRDHTEVAFVLVGEGKAKQDLMRRVRLADLKNVTFIDGIPKRQIQSMLKNFDVCYVGSSRSPLYRFGLAANKIYDYMYSGRPLLLSYSGEGDPATEYNAGMRVDAEDPTALAKAILSLLSLPQSERKEMGDRAFAAVLKYHEYNALAKELEKVLSPPGAN